MAVYKNVSGQALHIGNRIIRPFEIFEVKADKKDGISEEEKAVLKALEEGLIIEQITEVKPKKKKPINEDK